MTRRRFRRVTPIRALFLWGLLVVGLPACSRSAEDAPLDADAVATAESTVVIDYVGTLEDGTEFDRGDGVTFPLADFVPGFRDGIIGMRPGETKTLVIPPALAYGAEGVPGSIPPNATLTFDVTLHAIR